MASLTDQGASKIALETYVRNTENVRIELPDGEKVTYNVIETIEDKSTGLHGYVLENEITNEIVISFEGTQTKNGFTQSVNDIQEDINVIVLGDSSYTVHSQLTHQMFINIYYFYRLYVFIVVIYVVFYCFLCLVNCFLVKIPTVHKTTS